MKPIPVLGLKLFTLDYYRKLYRDFCNIAGDVLSPYYADLHLVVNWERDGEEIRNFVDPKTGRPYSRPQNTDFFFRPGLTYPYKSQRGFSVWHLSAGSIFSHVGQSIFAVQHEDLPLLLGLVNSSSYRGLLDLITAFGRREVGYVGSIPVPANAAILSDIAKECLRAKRSLDTANESSHVFVLPSLLQVPGDRLTKRIEAWTGRVAEAETNLANLQQQIDEIAFRLYSIAEEDQRTMRASLDGGVAVEDGEEDEASSEGERTPAADSRNLVADLLGYALGAVLGRWDIRYAANSRVHPELPDPFAPLPAYSPGMLTGKDGLPPHEAPPDYPLRIDWDGILVDDPNHSDDIVRCVREVLDSSLALGPWSFEAKDQGQTTKNNKDNKDNVDWEREACDILGVKELRDYFRKPGKGGFWVDHVSRYSKSRRKAPIYWLLQSSKKNYALWIYYHRLDKDILFKALLNYVEPKIRLEESRLEPLRAQRAAAGTSGKGAKRLEKEIGRQEVIISEVRDFEDKLRRAANLHLEPDLNDGVVLNVAPLWELVPWKEAKEYRDELLDGKYEWSSIGKQLREKGIVHGP